MATPSIGASTFDYLWGTVPPIQASTVDITRPGIDNHAYRDGGARSEVGQLFTVKGYSTAANAETAHLANLGLVDASPITVTYSNGETVTNVQPLNVRKQKQIQEVKTRSGGSGNFLLWEIWTVQQRS